MSDNDARGWREVDDGFCRDMRHKLRVADELRGVDDDKALKLADNWLTRRAASQPRDAAIEMERRDRRHALRRRLINEALCWLGLIGIALLGAATYWAIRLLGVK